MIEFVEQQEVELIPRNSQIRERRKAGTEPVHVGGILLFIWPADWTDGGAWIREDWALLDYFEVVVGGWLDKELVCANDVVVAMRLSRRYGAIPLQYAEQHPVLYFVQHGDLRPRC
jgi:hypothetical protein